MMKKTLLTAAVAVALGAPLAAMGSDVIGSAQNSQNIDGVLNIGAQNPAPNAPVNSYNDAINGSQNIGISEGFNEINSDNLVAITEDGNVLFAQNADQSIAQTDLDATVAGNYVVVDGVLNIGAQNPAPNTQTNNKRTATNTIGDAFSGASGIAVISQNTGHANSIQQSTVVQSNFKLN
jgi:hypothetical protein